MIPSADTRLMLRLEEARKREQEQLNNNAKGSHLLEQTKWLRSELERTVQRDRQHMPPAGRGAGSPPGGVRIGSSRSLSPQRSYTVKDLSGLWQLISTEEGGHPIEYPLTVRHSVQSGKIQGTADVNGTNFMLSGAVHSRTAVFNIHWGVGAVSSVKLERTSENTFAGTYLNSYNGASGTAKVIVSMTSQLTSGASVIDSVSNTRVTLEARYSGDSPVLTGSWWVVGPDNIRRLRTEAELILPQHELPTPPPHSHPLMVAPSSPTRSVGYQSRASGSPHSSPVRVITPTRGSPQRTEQAADELVRAEKEKAALEHRLAEANQKVAELKAELRYPPSMSSSPMVGVGIESSPPLSSIPVAVSPSVGNQSIPRQILSPSPASPPPQNTEPVAGGIISPPPVGIPSDVTSQQVNGVTTTTTVAIQPHQIPVSPQSPIAQEPHRSSPPSRPVCRSPASPTAGGPPSLKSSLDGPSRMPQLSHSAAIPPPEMPSSEQPSVSSIPPAQPMPSAVVSASGEVSNTPTESNISVNDTHAQADELARKAASEEQAAKERLAAERSAAEQQALEAAARKAAEDAAVAEREAAEKKAAEDAEKQAAEKREAERVAEQKAAEESQRLEAERKAAEEAKQAEAAKKEAEQLAAENKKAEDDERAAAEKKAAEEAEKEAAAKIATEEAEKEAAAKKAAEEAEKEAAAKKAAEEAEKEAAEKKAAEEAEKEAAAKKAAEDAEKEAAAKKAAEEAEKEAAAKKAAEEAEKEAAAKKAAEDAEKEAAAKKAAEEAEKEAAAKKAAEEAEKEAAAKKAAEDAEKKAAEEAEKEAAKKAAETKAAAKKAAKKKEELELGEGEWIEMRKLGDWTEWYDVDKKAFRYEKDEKMVGSILDTKEVDLDAEANKLLEGKKWVSTSRNDKTYFYHKTTKVSVNKLTKVVQDNLKATQTELEARLAATSVNMKTTAVAVVDGDKEVPLKDAFVTLFNVVSSRDPQKKK
eukprot:TRINITY_DN2762_c0_g1_i1.p1 TRINITY_DN2762_c0_g1~~TRINITY_DN2762_c0_g1_i1.p1  ORF type:complete len:982 (+),score=374.37 TRINITY_DN2762_c0_g1_i1:46-2991(+)